MYFLILSQYISRYPNSFIRKSEWESEVAQSCLTLCVPMDCSLPGSSVHGIFQAIVLEWIAISFSRGLSQPRNWTWVSRIVDRCFTIWATRKVLEGLVGLHRIIHLQLLQRYWSGHKLGLLWYGMVCLGNELRSFCRFWDCIQVLHFIDSFVDYDGYSISSKGFLPTVVDIMVIWIKFTHSNPF